MNSSRQITKKLKSVTHYLISLMLMSAFLYWAFREVEPAALWATIKSLSISWIAFIALTELGTLVIRSWRWAVLITPFAPQVTLRDTSLALAICYSANVVIPRAGEILRAVSLKWTREVSIGATLATVVVERILDTIWLILFLGLSLLLLRGRLDEVFPGLGSLSIFVLIGCILTLAGLALVSLYQERAIARVQPLLRRLSPGLADKLIHLLGTFIHGLQALHSPSAYGKIILSSILLNLGYTAIIYQAFAGFGFTRDYGLGLDAALVIMAISSIGVIFPTPGSAGSYHAFFGKALIHFYALDKHDALACATVVHALATFTYLAVGVPALLIQRRRKARQPATARSTYPGAASGRYPPCNAGTTWRT